MWAAPLFLMVALAADAAEQLVHEGDLRLRDLAYSNLGGLGPNLGKPDGMRFDNATVSYDGKPIDLVIVAEDNYTPHDILQNKNSGEGIQFGNINIKVGTKVQLMFKFFYSGTSKPATKDKFRLTFHLIDERSTITVNYHAHGPFKGFEEYCLSSHSLLQHTTNKDPAGVSLTPSTVRSIYAPDDPNALTKVQKSQAVTFSFADVSEFPVSFAISGPVGDAGVNLVFSGADAVTESCTPWIGGSDDFSSTYLAAPGAQSVWPHVPECLVESRRAAATVNDHGLHAIAVRCCTDTAGSSPGCKEAVTHAEAASHCKSQGQRLCTRAELDADKARDGGEAGCGFDSFLVWTSDRCSGHLAVPGASSVWTRRPECVMDTETNSATQNADKTFEIGVRCCSSSKPGTSPGCAKGLPYLMAKAKCEDAGQRLCTKDELDADKAVDSGCGFDSYMVWTSTACGDQSGAAGSTSSAPEVTSPPPEVGSTSGAPEVASPSPEASSSTVPPNIHIQTDGDIKVKTDGGITRIVGLPYNCNDGIKEWDHWTSDKKEWCCGTYGVACRTFTATSTYNCQTGFVPFFSQLGWSNEQKAWCNGEGDSLTTAPSYNCQDGFKDWQTAWTPAKKEWCCENESKGCHAVTNPPYDCAEATEFRNGENTWSAQRRKWCCENHDTGCRRASEPFDCVAGFAKWETGWSEKKKEWCCWSYRKGCMATTTGSPTTTASLPFDCEAGYADWVRDWSVQKKKWCCDHLSRGCHSTSEPYDCQAGLANWKMGWSLSKKTWCCSHHQKGCEVATTSAAYDCEAGFQNWQAGWSIGKKAWCCIRARRGCLTTTTVAEEYDCEAGLMHWHLGWSKSKKVWCCQHHSKGCETATPVTTKAPFDCEAGFIHWERGWSLDKKRWCCSHLSRGCETGPTSAPFDCQDGFTTWATTWGYYKKQYCCKHFSRGCGTRLQQKFGRNLEPVKAPAQLVTATGATRVRLFKLTPSLVLAVAGLLPAVLGAVGLRAACASRSSARASASHVQLAGPLVAEAAPAE